jgi:hypothetical protein
MTPTQGFLKVEKLSAGNLPIPLHPFPWEGEKREIGVATAQ